MRSTVASGLLLLLVAAPIGAQQNGVASRVSGSLDSKLVDPTCELKGGDFRVKSGKTYLKTGIEASEQANRTRSLRDGVRGTDGEHQRRAKHQSGGLVLAGADLPAAGRFGGGGHRVCARRETRPGLQSRHRIVSLSGLGRAG